MQEEVNLYIEMAEEAMKGSIDHLHRELAKIRTGKASPSMLSGIIVPYYGTPTPLSQTANISIADSKSLVIQPWDKTMLGAIEKAIFEANLGLTPQNDGELIRINIPPLTEERRLDMVKWVKALGEDSKVSIRNARREVMDGIKSAVKEGFPEDAGKKRENEVQEMTNDFGKKVDQLIEAKEKDIMTI